MKGIKRLLAAAALPLVLAGCGREPMEVRTFTQGPGIFDIEKVERYEDRIEVVRTGPGLTFDAQCETHDTHTFYPCDRRWIDKKPYGSLDYWKTECPLDYGAYERSGQADSYMQGKYEEDIALLKAQGWNFPGE
ncbi:MAG: hypothetical protein HYW25_04815 [Candidatus Aenigmarchaeota archaeon]|nr:hypothetical protein [Candidatus Aenigmarchaeota archaeon]